MPPITFGQKVKLIRTFCGISQQDLADKIGIERSFLSYFENDKMDFKPERIKALEDALGVDSLNSPIEMLLAQLSDHAKKNPNTTLALAA